MNLLSKTYYKKKTKQKLQVRWTHDSLTGTVTMKAVIKISIPIISSFVPYTYVLISTYVDFLPKHSPANSIVSGRTSLFHI